MKTDGETHFRSTQKDGIGKAQSQEVLNRLAHDGVNGLMLPLEWIYDHRIVPEFGAAVGESAAAVFGHVFLFSFGNKHQVAQDAVHRVGRRSHGPNAPR